MRFTNHLYHAVAQALSLSTVGIAVLVLIEWSFGIPTLTGLVPGFAEVEILAAFGFIFAAVSILTLNATAHGMGAVRQSGHIRSLLPAVVAGLMGMATLIGYAFDIVPGTTHPAPMSLHSAVSFILFALAVVTFASETRAIQRISESAVLLMTWISGLAAVGYLYHAQSLYTFKPYGSMALLTAVSFLMLGAALLCMRPDRGIMSVLTSQEAGGLMLRRMVPLTLGMVIAIGWLHLAGETAGWFNRTFGLMAVVGLNLGGFSLILWVVARILSRADLERRESQVRLHLAKDAASLGIHDYDVTRGTIRWDERVRQLWGVKPEEPVTIDTFWAGVHLDDQAATKASIDRALDPSGNGRYHTEFRVLSRTDGSIRWVGATGRAIFEQGRAVRLVGTALDITERKRHETELALRARQQSHLYELADAVNRAEALPNLYKTALDVIIASLNADRASILLFDDDGVMRFRAWRCLSDVYRSDVEGHSPWTADERDPQPIHVGNVAESKIEPSLIAVIRQEGIQALSFIPLMYGGRLLGKFMLYFDRPHSMSEDETNLAQAIAGTLSVGLERKTVESRLYESNNRLQALAAHLEKLVDERTRELVHSRDQLRALATELNLAEQRERKRLATDLHDHLQQTLVLGKLKMGQSKRFATGMPELAKMIEETDCVFSDALKYTRTLVAELSPPVLRDHGLAAGLKWLAEYMIKREVSVMVIVTATEDLRLPEDQAVLLFQSVRELLINSSKHAGTGQATVRMVQQGISLAITVRDEGSGFDPTLAETPSGTLSSKFGLFSIRERMRALGGSFDIQSSPGQGTTATLLLPLSGTAAGAVGESECRTESRQETPATETLTTMSSVMAHASHATHHISETRVLLVDDHAMVRQGLRSVLDAYNDIRVVGEAQDGSEAVRLVEKLRPRVVVMDVNMPKMNGIEATAFIKMNWPETIVIGISINTGNDNAAAMTRAGAIRLLTKEAAVDELYAVIRREIAQEVHF